MDAGRLWNAFGGASFALMGLSLAAGARRHARDNLQWQKQWRQATGRDASGEEGDAGLVLGYRLGGAAMAALGAWLALAAPPSRRLPGPGESLAAGVLLCALALALAWSRFRSRPGRGPSFLAGEELSPRPSWDERLGEAAVWALLALWLAFGASLIFR